MRHVTALLALMAVRSTLGFVHCIGYAVSTIEVLGDPDRTTVVWATDPNPARTKQVGIFEELNPDLEGLVDKSDATKLATKDKYNFRVHSKKTHYRY